MIINGARRVIAVPAAAALVALACGCNALLKQVDGTIVDADSGLDAASSDAAAPPNEAASAPDTSTDPANCGKRGHDCLGGTCVEGACQPVRILSAAGKVEALLFAGDEICWNTDVTALGCMGRGASCDSGHCTPYSRDVWPGIPAYANGRFYWSDNTDIVSAMAGPLRGAAKVFAANQTFVTEIVATNDWLYWLELHFEGQPMPTPAILRAPLGVDGGASAPEVFATSVTTEGFRRGLAVDGETAYWLRYDFDHLYRRRASDPLCDYDGCTWVHLGRQGTNQVLVDARWVYVAAIGVEPDFGLDGSIVRVDKTCEGDACVEQLSPYLVNPGMATDGNDLYYIDIEDQGKEIAIHRIPNKEPCIAGCEEIFRMNHQAASRTPDPELLLVDDKAIYYTLNRAEVYRLAK